MQMTWMAEVLLLLGGTASAGESNGAGVILLDVRDYGALPDDLVDDTAGIQAALDAACALMSSPITDSVEVFLPAGRYDVSKGPAPGPFTPWVILKLRCGGFALRGEIGGETRIRPADGQGEFESLLGGEAFQTDLDDLEITDITFDGNGANNPITEGDAEFDDLFLNRRHAVRIYWGDRVVIRRCRFVEWKVVNVVTINGEEVADAELTDCEFRGIGDLTGTVPDWDHSTIYTDCDGALVADNVFQSQGIGAFGARAAIETHGHRQIVRRNRVEAYSAGINVTGATVLGSEFHRVEDNVLLDVSSGIRIWALELEGNPPGEPVLSDVVIARNTIVLDVDGWRVTQDPFTQASRGIDLFGLSDGVIEDLTLAHNSIEFTNFGAKPRSYDVDAHGIRLAPAALPNLPIRGLVIRGNVIRQALASGMYIGSGLLDGALIEANRIVDAGVGPDFLAGGLRTGILVYGAYMDLALRHNCFVVGSSTDATPRTMEQAIFVFGDSFGGNVVVDSMLEVPPGEGAVFFREDAGVGVPWSVEAPRSTCRLSRRRGR